MTEPTPNLNGGAPFSTPVKSSFFDSLLRKVKDDDKDKDKDSKDVSSHSASATPAASPTAASAATALSFAAPTTAVSTSSSTSTSEADTASKSKSKQPSMEDVSLLMDQLSALSQSLADSQMANLELKQNSDRTQALYDAMKVERDFMITKSEQQEKEMQRLREKISFSALDATNEQLKQLKADLATAQTENEALKSQNQILYQNYADINAEYQSVHEDLEHKEGELKRLTTEAEEFGEARASHESSVVSYKTKVTELEEQLLELQEQAQADKAALEQARAAEIEANRDELQAQLQTVRDELHAMTTDRNHCRKRTESIHLDMKRLHMQLAVKDKEQEKHKEEAQRLREDLARKSKSLQDALTALAVAMETANFAPKTSAPAVDTIVVSGTGSVGGKDLQGLQSLCNKLSETIKEKDDQIGVLRKQIVGLGKRVIELEAGTLPDLNEKIDEPNTPMSSKSINSLPTSPHNPNESSTVSTSLPSLPTSPAHSTPHDSSTSFSTAAADAAAATQRAANPETDFPKLSSYSNRSSFSVPTDATSVALAEEKRRKISSAAASYLANVEPDLP